MSKTILAVAILGMFCCVSAAGLRAAGRSTPPVQDIMISGHDLHKTVDCNGKNVVIDANDSTITLRGECNEIQVNGSTNTITVDVVASIVLNSADNTVRWKKAAKGNKPKVVDKSNGNKVVQVK